MKNVECKKGRIGILATSIAQTIGERKKRCERAGAGERAGARRSVCGRWPAAARRIAYPAGAREDGRAGRYAPQADSQSAPAPHPASRRWPV